MTVVVLGGGAVGSLFAARLVRCGRSVELVGRADHVAAIRANGLTVLGPTPETFRLRAETELAAGTEAEAVLLTVKTFDLERAATELARAIPRPVPTLLTQNGLGIEPTAHAALAAGGWTAPAAWAVRAVHSVPATWVRPGVVRAAGEGEVLLPVPEERPESAAVLRFFARLLTDAGLLVRAVPRFEREVWRKALVNAAINPVTATHGVENGRLLEGPERAEALALLAEARRAAAFAGHDFSEEESVRDFERVARATAANRSSMLQDLERGRPTEIESISGEIVRIAAARGVDLPRTRAIVEEVRRRTRRTTSAPQPS